MQHAIYMTHVLLRGPFQFHGNLCCGSALCFKAMSGWDGAISPQQQQPRAA